MGRMRCSAEWQGTGVLVLRERTIKGILDLLRRLLQGSVIGADAVRFRLGLPAAPRTDHGVDHSRAGLLTGPGAVDRGRGGCTGATTATTASARR